MSQGQQQLISRVVDEHEYEFQKFGAKQGLKVLMKLSKLLGKPLALAMDAFGSNGAKGILSNIKSDILAQAVEALTSGMDEESTLDLIEELTARSLLCDGKKVNFNSHYEGNYAHLFKVLSAALEVQYGNFFDALPAFRGGTQAKSATTPEATP